MRYLLGFSGASRHILGLHRLHTKHSKNMQMEKRTLVLLLLGLVLVLSLDSSQAARRLRKKPKVYNALITTDDNLTSSRAYPVIQPTIHEPGYAPFGPYNPYGFYSPPSVRFGQPIVPGLTPNERLPYPLPTGGQYSAGFAPHEDQQPVETPVEQQPAPPSLEPKEMTKEQTPLPLNEQGLPPVLIRLPSQYTGQPTHLLPYPYSQYPVIYDQAGYVRQNYLPPYDYYPTQGYPVREPTTAADAPAPPPPPSPPKEEPQPLPLELSLEPVKPSFEDIRNGSESKNREVPDVPPPPIPSGPRRPQPAEPDN